MDKSKKIGFAIVLGIPLFLAFGGSVFVLVASARASKSIDSERLIARRLGIPTEPGDLSTTRIPPSQNAATLYRRLDGLLTGDLAKQQKLITNGTGKELTSAEAEARSAALVKLGPMLALATQLDTHPHCDFERDWSQGQYLRFSEFPGMRSLEKDLVLQADTQDLHGDSAGAMKSLGYAERVAVDAGADPTLISMLVRLAGKSIVNREYQTLISRHSRDTAYLDSISKRVQASSALPDIKFYCRGEVVLGISAIRSLTDLRPFRSYAGDSDSESETGSSESGASFQRAFFQSHLVQNTLSTKLLAAWEVAWSKFPKDTEDWDAYLRALSAMEVSIDKDTSLSNAFNRILFPIFDQASLAVGKLQAQNRMLLTSIEVLKIRNATGKLPVVTPSRLGPLRLDPFDGNPLRYVRMGSGFKLYSIGTDRKDDGGHPRTPGDPDGTSVDDVVEFK